jgi:hypothetical protein
MSTTIDNRNSFDQSIYSNGSYSNFTHMTPDRLKKPRPQFVRQQARAQQNKTYFSEQNPIVKTYTPREKPNIEIKRNIRLRQNPQRSRRQKEGEVQNKYRKRRNPLKIHNPLKKLSVSGSSNLVMLSNLAISDLMEQVVSDKQVIVSDKPFILEPFTNINIIYSLEDIDLENAKELEKEREKEKLITITETMLSLKNIKICDSVKSRTNYIKNYEIDRNGDLVFLFSCGITPEILFMMDKFKEINRLCLTRMNIIRTYGDGFDKIEGKENYSYHYIDPYEISWRIQEHLFLLFNKGIKFTHIDHCGNIAVNFNKLKNMMCSAIQMTDIQYDTKLKIAADINNNFFN